MTLSPTTCPSSASTSSSTPPGDGSFAPYTTSMDSISLISLLNHKRQTRGPTDPATTTRTRMLPSTYFLLQQTRSSRPMKISDILQDALQLCEDIDEDLSDDEHGPRGDDNGVMFSRANSLPRQHHASQERTRRSPHRTRQEEQHGWPKDQ